jgi:monoamine oxidase
MSAMPTVQVAIVGAGLSGLSAAKAVHDADLSYVVLEGMDRVGGKVLSAATKDDGTKPIELGAAWINDTTQSEMYALAKRFGFGLVQQRAEGSSFYQTGDGKFAVLPFELPEPVSNSPLSLAC